MQLCHLTLSTTRREPVVLSTRSRRAVVRTVARVAGRHGLLFSVVDDHLHLVVEGERRAVGAKASGLTRALRPVVAPKTNGFHIQRSRGAVTSSGSCATWSPSRSSTRCPNTPAWLRGPASRIWWGPAS